VWCGVVFYVVELWGKFKGGFNDPQVWMVNTEGADAQVVIEWESSILQMED
jgi:hypothetical protein